MNLINSTHRPDEAKPSSAQSDAVSMSVFQMIVLLGFAWLIGTFVFEVAVAGAEPDSELSAPFKPVRIFENLLRDEAELGLASTSLEGLHRVDANSRIRKRLEFVIETETHKLARITAIQNAVQLADGDSNASKSIVSDALIDSMPSVSEKFKLAYAALSDKPRTLADQLDMGSVWTDVHLSDMPGLIRLTSNTEGFAPLFVDRVPFIAAGFKKGGSRSPVREAKPTSEIWNLPQLPKGDGGNLEEEPFVVASAQPVSEDTFRTSSLKVASAPEYKAPIVTTRKLPRERLTPQPVIDLQPPSIDQLVAESTEPVDANDEPSPTVVEDVTKVASKSVVTSPAPPDVVIAKSVSENTTSPSSVLFSATERLDAAGRCTRAKTCTKADRRGRRSGSRPRADPAANSANHQTACGVNDRSPDSATRCLEWRCNGHSKAEVHQKFRVAAMGSV